MKNKNVELATAEVREALVNFLNSSQFGEGWNEKHRIKGAYNDMATWLNFFIHQNDMSVAKLEEVVVDSDDGDLEQNDNEVLKVETSF